MAMWYSRVYVINYKLIQYDDIYIIKEAISMTS